MIPRYQPPVYSPLRLSALLRAATRTSAPAGRASRGEVKAALARRFSSHAVELTDSGTSALIVALRLTAGEGGTVAFPGYACIDLAAAARYAGVRVRLYDIDPETLSPDIESVTRTLDRGASAIVVAHLYGYPADVPAVAEVAGRYGVTVIEDAAQGAGGVLRGTLLGAFGPLSILSFGRGKGTTGGGGGALMATSGEWAERIGAAAASLRRPARGIPEISGAAAQWMFGRPGLYALPAAIPSLRLGDMVYHEAHEPTELSAGASALVRSALDLDEAEISARRGNAAQLRSAMDHADVSPIRALQGGTAGELRLPVRARQREPHSRLGVLRGYPLTLAEQLELRPCLHEGEREQPGSLELRRSLFTLPTHSLLRAADITALQAWLRAK